MPVESSVEDETGAGARNRRDPGEEFTKLVEPLRAQLHAHCYRMLGSVHDADDALQDALLRAWRGMHTLKEEGSLRAWLYTVATRTCLDLAAARGRRALPMDLGPASERVVLADTPSTEVAWLEPYPDAVYERRETVELAFVAALQHLPGNQRAALLLFDVLGFSAAEIAAMMRTTPTSVNSALARARRLVAERVPAPAQQRTLRDVGDARVRQLVTRYATAMERGDTAGLVALLTEDVTWSMPPLPHWYRGATAIEFAAEVPLKRCGSWRHLPATANAQPAVACYLRDRGTGSHRAWSVNVLALRGDRISAITSFIGEAHFTRLGLPPAL
ncbi:sigma-70 family RNA polymerase sigma factor [Dactylosporangium aurantiacum]|uniref:Sigma-70 family RNA polymerase sigma factor n=1 Tax=Dactylosporangium aurantiacum TaxID=35754 RepID=A0A9Q9IFI6_9ACTN|nr:sigma-70 family RNA polymerase sigma factor [Dactylosporangium aurantiacum]MDG6102001.1 sigma-70 family RNA polymerase sigma factor [Dactylosporangium aurantiacum]UWZ53658.1 sigma-70 family RNA polymerase sigma factor [Dactylosporangium aurantiacum]